MDRSVCAAALVGKLLKMPRTEASRRSAAAKKRTADRHGGVAYMAVALTDGAVPPHDEKALTDTVPENHSPPAWQAVATAASSVTDGVKFHPHNQKDLTDIPWQYFWQYH
ncbi:hypothetical protein AOLI_G00195480 [Acnodon oligacanthus]